MEKKIEPDLRAELGRNIRVARERLGISQQVLAERAELSPGHMNDIEQGKKWVSAPALRRLSTALHAEPWMLLWSPGEIKAPDDEIAVRKALAAFAARVRVEMEQALRQAMTETVRQHTEK